MLEKERDKIIDWVCKNKPDLNLKIFENIGDLGLAIKNKMSTANSYQIAFKRLLEEQKQKKSVLANILQKVEQDIKEQKKQENEKSSELLKNVLPERKEALDQLISSADSTDVPDIVNLIEASLSSLDLLVRQCGNPQEFVQQLKPLHEKLDAYKKYLESDTYPLCKKIYALEKKPLDLNDDTIRSLKELKTKIAQEREAIIQPISSDQSSTVYAELLMQKLTIAEKILEEFLSLARMANEIII